mgnify:CR=1 FL=1
MNISRIFQQNREVIFSFVLSFLISFLIIYFVPFSSIVNNEQKKQKDFNIFIKLKDIDRMNILIKKLPIEVVF